MVSSRFKTKRINKPEYKASNLVVATPRYSYTASANVIAS